MDPLFAIPIAIGGGLLLWTACSLATGRFAVENARYNFLRSYPGFEVRSAPPHVVASLTYESADMKAASSGAFRPLAKFIFGGNRARAGPGSESIAMTSPVQILPSAGGGAHVVSFVLPAKYTAVEQVPLPLDARVRVELVPRGFTAVRPLRATLGERMSSARFRDESAALLRDVAAAGLRVGAEPPKQLSYDPPWTPFFLMRNEVSVGLQDSEGEGAGGGYAPPG
jgi:hypothetical protein